MKHQNENEKEKEKQKAKQECILKKETEHKDFLEDYKVEMRSDHIKQILAEEEKILQFHNYMNSLRQSPKRVKELIDFEFETCFNTLYSYLYFTLGGYKNIDEYLIINYHMEDFFETEEDFDNQKNQSIRKAEAVLVENIDQGMKFIIDNDINFKKQFFNFIQFQIFEHGDIYTYCIYITQEFLRHQIELRVDLELINYQEVLLYFQEKIFTQQRQKIQEKRKSEMEVEKESEKDEFLSDKEVSNIEERMEDFGIRKEESVYLDEKEIDDYFNSQKGNQIDFSDEIFLD